MTILTAQPQPIEIELERSALVIVDMQNAFVSKGGMFEQRGFDLESGRKAAESIQRISDKARGRKVKVIYIAHVLSSDLREVGPDSTFWHKVLKFYRDDSKWEDKFIIRGTWGVEIIDSLKPRQGDLLVEKPRFSAFFGTNLDTILRSLNLKYLFFAGCATNMCVEASIRDAANLNYFPILIPDATAHTGPAYVQQATEYNVKSAIGWLARSEEVIRALTE